MLFDTDTYVYRRQMLKQRVGSGLILLLGNNASPINYPANGYKYRQDSTFYYFYGLKREGLAGLIDVDNDEEWLFGDDISIDDIVWYGKVDSVAEMAAQAGVEKSGSMKKLYEFMYDRIDYERQLHFLPPYRHSNMILLEDLTGIYAPVQQESASVELIKAVVEQRIVKFHNEIAEMERACAIGYEMHTTAMKLCKPGVKEEYIAGVLSGIASKYGGMTSYETILSVRGEIMHGAPSSREMQAGELMLCDAGAETSEYYCSDHTRTTPVSGKFNQRQREIYSIVEACHDYAISLAKPGVKWWDIHFAVARLMTNKLKELGLMKGDTEEAVIAGAHAMFMPHGLGHMMGLDVHDMEDLGQIYVGFDDEVKPNLEQFGTNCLRCGRRLQEGFVLSDEPGIYFIPALIDDWRAKGHCKEFLNFDLLETYKGFGGIRIEDDILITKDGCRVLGEKKIPYHIDEVEEFINQN